MKDYSSPARNNSIDSQNLNTRGHLKYKRGREEFQDKNLIKRLQKQYLEEQMRLKKEREH